jgi:hypothetical protein
MIPLVICTPDVIIFLVRCPEGIRTECDIRFREFSDPARHSTIGLRSYVSDLFHPAISPIPLLSAAPKGIGLKSNIRLSRVLITFFWITSSEVSTHSRPVLKRRLGGLDLR